MPAVNFIVRWPDGREESCYSPSTIICEFFENGKSYSLDDFQSLSVKAYTRASERVEERFGYACSSARDQLMLIQSRINQFRDSGARGQITVLNMNQ